MSTRVKTIKNMKKIISIVGIICALGAVVSSATQFYSLTYPPAIIAFLCALYLIYISKTAPTKPKAIQYIILLVIISIGLTIYKGTIETSEDNHTEQLEPINIEQEDEPEID